MKRLLSIVLLSGLALPLGAHVGAQELAVGVLRFDPFAEPDLERPSVEAARKRRWSPELRATLAAGPQSMANLGGTILNIGDEAHGYRLIEVGEGDAIFLKGNARVVLTTSPGEDR